MSSSLSSVLPGCALTISNDVVRCLRVMSPLHARGAFRTCWLSFAAHSAQSLGEQVRVEKRRLLRVCSAQHGTEFQSACG